MIVYDYIKLSKIFVLCHQYTHLRYWKTSFVVIDYNTALQTYILNVIEPLPFK